MIRPGNYGNDDYFHCLAWNINFVHGNTACNVRIYSDPGFSGSNLNELNFNRSGKSGMKCPQHEKQQQYCLQNNFCIRQIIPPFFTECILKQEIKSLYLADGIIPSVRNIKVGPIGSDANGVVEERCSPDSVRGSYRFVHRG